MLSLSLNLPNLSLCSRPMPHSCTIQSILPLPNLESCAVILHSWFFLSSHLSCAIIVHSRSSICLGSSYSNCTASTVAQSNCTACYCLCSSWHFMWSYRTDLFHHCFAHSEGLQGPTMQALCPFLRHCIMPHRNKAYIVCMCSDCIESCGSRGKRMTETELLLHTVHAQASTATTVGDSIW